MQSLKTNNNFKCYPSINHKNIKNNNINIKPYKNNLNKYKIITINNNSFNLPRRNIITKSYNDITIDWVWQSYIIGKGIILFIMFYTTLNWMFYRRERRMIEKNRKDK